MTRQGAWLRAGLCIWLTGNCTSWTSNSAALTSFFGGANSSMLYWWNDGSGQPCANSGPLYCFER